MAKPGRKPRAKRGSLEVLEAGEPSKYDLGPAPTHLGELARDFWNTTRDKLIAIRVEVLPFDLETMAILYARARRAEDQVEDVGEWFVDKQTGTPRPHPALRTAETSRRELRLMLEHVGLSSVGRARKKGEDKPPAGPNPYAKPGS